MRRLVRLAVTAAAMLASGGAVAADDRYVAEAGGIRLEVSAPRADIVRIRAGQGTLPEDASWAVMREVRVRTAPLEVREAPELVTIETGELTVKLDRRTLAVTVSDRAGKIVLADAPGGALRFENGGFTARKAMLPDAHFFGLGDKTGPVDRRGGAFTFWNTDTFGFGTATDPIYKSIPFVLGMDERGGAFGLFMDNTHRGFMDFGKRERAAFAFGAEAGPVDYYVMSGPDAKDIVRDYAYLTGTQPLMPLWSLGFQQSHWGYMTRGEVEGIVDRLRSDRIPADVIWLDIDYQDRNRPFTVNTASFPDLAGMVKGFKAKGIETVVITDLHVARAPGEGYKAYDSGTAEDVFLKRPDGATYVGEVWPGDSVFPDFTNAKAREWWGRQYRMFTDMGLSGFWNDMNEPAIFKSPTKTMPLDVIHRIDDPAFAPRRTSQAEIHNVYGMLNTRATYEGVRKLTPDVRPFVMTRATYAGGQRYAATWTGDNVSSWAHLKLSTAQLLNLGLSGFAYAGDDIGGFSGEAPSPELLTRWIQIGAFNPVFRDHYQKGRPKQEPWVHGPEHLALRRAAIEERYRLMPYLYALAEENSRTGLPIMRPVFMNYPAVLAKGDRLGDTEDQFMLGDDLLIAPSFTGESTGAYKAVLPGPGWYDYWTGERLAASELQVTPRLDTLPVFVRPGAILPRQPLVQSTKITPQGNLELAIYPGDDCRGTLYADDGVSFGYTRGEFLRQAVTCDATTLRFGARAGRFKPWWRGFDVVVHGWSGAPPRVTLAGKPIAARVERGALHFALPDLARAATVTIAR